MNNFKVFKRAAGLVVSAAVAFSMCLPSFASSAEVVCTETSDGVYVVSGSGTLESDIIPSDAVSVTVQDGITSIASYAFYNMPELSYISLPSSLQSVSSYAFCHLDSLTELTLPEGLTRVGAEAFSDFGLLEKLNLPSTLSSIGNNAFSDMPSLETITVASGDYFTVKNGVLFSSDLTAIVRYPAGITATSFTVPDTVTAIKPYAFEGCAFLTDIALSDSLTTIGDYAFISSGLTSLNLTASVQKIGYRAFYGCHSLGSVTVASQNDSFCAIDGVLFSKDKKTLVYYPCAKQGTSYTVADFVRRIEGGAINTTQLEKLTVAPTVIEIGTWGITGPSDYLKKLEIIGYAGSVVHTYSEDPSSVTFTSLGDHTYINGDVDCNGKVNIRDVVALYQKVSRWNVIINKTVADVNADTDISVRDVVLLYQYVSGWSVTIQ